VHACLSALQKDAASANKTEWVQRLHHILSAAEMRRCREVLTKEIDSAVPTVRAVGLQLIKEGGYDLQTLVLTNKCLALLWPPGSKSTLEDRMAFCSDCLEAALPEDDDDDDRELLKLNLVSEDLLNSAIRALSSFSDMGVRCGVLKQELYIEYEGQSGEDAGGLRRQFFDTFTRELRESSLWAQTPLGSLRPADEAAVGAGNAEAQTHMETCGRVCGMALYQELHRRLGVEEYPHIYKDQPPNLFGDAFARYFIRLVQHNPPLSLAELQAELSAESLETEPDYRAGKSSLK
jgi:hypothetical protein